MALLNLHTKDIKNISSEFFTFGFQRIYTWTTGFSVLVPLSCSQQKHLEVVQNNAMRTMLGAPKWFSSCVMQSETSLIPLATRVKYIMACQQVAA